MTRAQRFARLVTVAVVRAPFLWRLFRGRLTRNFDRLAPEWEATRVSRERLAPMVAALWGVLAWKEFEGAPRKAKMYLALMFVFYCLGILLVAKANG